MQIYPPLRACVRFSLVLFGTTFLVIFGILAVGDYFAGRPVLHNLINEPLVIAFIFLALPLATSVFFYVVLRLWSWNIDRRGITGRSYWGRRLSFPWSTVADVGFLSIEGIPALVISSSSSKGKIYAYTLGVDTAAIHSELTRCVGPDHILTQWFRAAA